MITMAIGRETKEILEEIKEKDKNLKESEKEFTVTLTEEEWFTVINTLGFEFQGLHSGRLDDFKGLKRRIKAILEEFKKVFSSSEELIEEIELWEKEGKKGGDERSGNLVY